MDRCNFHAFIKRVKENVDIVSIVKEHVNLSQGLKGKCPFHDDQHPSFSVHQKNQYFHCFGCGKGGDVIEFIKLKKNMTFWEALSDLAKSAGILIPTFDKEYVKQLEDESQIRAILLETASFYHSNLNDAAKDYLIKDRGIKEEIIKQFWLGYANGKLKDHLLGCNFSTDSCLRAGVIQKNQKGAIRDFFLDRIIFPNFFHGNVVYLTSRAINGGIPKYLHLSGGISYLYNEEALSNENVYLAEGILDCLSLIQEGYPSCAILGSCAFKEEYVSKLSNCKKLFLCLDGDKAGKEGALRIANLVPDKAMIVQLPNSQDVNDVLRANRKEEMQRFIASAKDVVEYYLDQIPTATDKIDLSVKLTSVLAILKNKTKPEIEAYLEKIKLRFGLNSKDIDGYRGLLKEVRKQEAFSKRTEKNKEKAAANYIAIFENLIDLVDANGKAAFLVKEQDKIFTSVEYNKDGVVYIPPLKESIPWLLPSAENVIKTYGLYVGQSNADLDRVLFDALVEYFKSVSELPSNAHYYFVAAWVLHTYILEQVHYSPIICFFAIPERGKSRTGKGIINIAYRGIHVESLRDAYIVRVAKNFCSSLFFDVKDISKKAKEAGSEDILLLRFEKGAKVPRVIYPELGDFRDIAYFNVFGPTIIATNEGMDEILETRAVTINMPETTKKFENDITPETSLQLKEELLVFRARHFGHKLPDIPKPANGRLGDILKPILQIIRLVRPDLEQEIMVLVGEFTKKRLEEKAETIEAQILKAILALVDKVTNRGLAILEITNQCNSEIADDRFKITTQKVGRRLKAMGFDKCKTSGGASAIIYDPKVIDQLKAKFGIVDLTKTTNTLGITDISDNTDISNNIN